MDKQKFDQKAYVSDYIKTHMKKIDLKVQNKEYDRFKAACEAAGTPMATVLRRYIAEYTKEHLPDDWHPESD